mmetsp:Transcript_102715/g.203946  ORF Transcript_102715/g.203946 Transcript_102715/m.203946 type:complete len:374 (+) Transcript_102715:66-1187(+)
MAAACGGPRATILRRLEFPNTDVVTCHAFTSDERLLATCPGTEDIAIFQVHDNDIERTHVLSKHTQQVTGLAWSSSGKLVSCSEDRTAFVWEPLSNGGWQPILVELRAPRAALCVAWSPNGTRFAVGLSSRDVAVCYFEEKVHCWVAKKVGKSKAAVTALAWHPTSNYLATGSTDRRCIVYDVNEEQMLQGGSPFGDVQVTEDAGAWVNAVAFSPKGQFLAFLAHDSRIRIKDLTGGPTAAADVVRWRGLPFSAGAFVGERCFVAAGFDCFPVLFRQSAGRWELYGALDAGVELSSTPSDRQKGAASRQSFNEARSRFRGSTGQSGKEKDGVLATWHDNTITTCGLLNSGTNGAVRFSTSGLDGLVLVCELSP